jgi:hypothetical protein
MDKPVERQFEMTNDVLVGGKPGIPGDAYLFLLSIWLTAFGIWMTLIFDRCLGCARDGRTSQELRLTASKARRVPLIPGILSPQFSRPTSEKGQDKNWISALCC